MGTTLDNVGLRTEIPIPLLLLFLKTRAHAQSGVIKAGWGRERVKEIEHLEKDIWEMEEFDYLWWG